MPLDDWQFWFVTFMLSACFGSNHKKFSSKTETKVIAVDMRQNQRRLRLQSMENQNHPRECLKQKITIYLRSR